MSRTKLISLDLDGTLLDSNRKLPPENRKALQMARERGVELLISTGSPYQLIPFAELDGLDISYAITANGSAIYHYQTGECIYEESVDTETILPILEFLLTKDMHVDIFMDGKAYCQETHKDIIRKLDVPQSRKNYISNNRIWLQDPISYIRDNHLSVQKITMNFYPDHHGIFVDRDEVRTYLANHKELRLVSGGWKNLEITKHSANKGKALKELCKHIDASVDEVMAFGDSLNDLDIMRVAGRGIAMGNAMEEVKEAADEVTSSNDACGVAEVVWQLLKEAERKAE